MKYLVINILKEMTLNSGLVAKSAMYTHPIVFRTEYDNISEVLKRDDFLRVIGSVVTQRTAGDKLWLAIKDITPVIGTNNTGDIKKYLFELK